MLGRTSDLRARVVVSNGFSKFNMDHSAEEAERTGRLERFLTGAYPTAFWRKLLARWTRYGAVRHFLGRAARLPDAVVSSFPVSEVSHYLAIGLPRLFNPRGDFYDHMVVAAFRLYARAAARALARLPEGANVYHYRSGFGGRSLAVARAKGMVLLCEHSIAHPKALDYMIDHGGRMPSPAECGPLTRVWQFVADDVAASDFLVSNSDFVRKTMVAMGHPPERALVLYRGLDDEFLALLEGGDVPARVVHDGPLRLLFAGTFGRRKGANTLRAAVDLLKTVEGWTLTLAGPVYGDCVEDFRRICADGRVRDLGSLSRLGLARAMRQADVFVFPSLAEGSARVVFEALAAGCYVVTTENSGSVVGQDAEGVIVEPENPEQLADAIKALIADRARLAEAGARNAALIRAKYRQSDYGKELVALYDRIAAAASSPKERIRP